MIAALGLVRFLASFATLTVGPFACWNAYSEVWPSPSSRGAPDAQNPRGERLTESNAAHITGVLVNMARTLKHKRQPPCRCTMSSRTQLQLASRRSAKGAHPAQNSLPRLRRMVVYGGDGTADDGDE